MIHVTWVRRNVEEPESDVRELETRLSSALDQVCELPPPARLDTGELIRVEETVHEGSDSGPPDERHA